MTNQQPLKIGIIAPPWLTVPPHRYGGTELVVDVLCRGLAALGHEVHLFTVGESTCEVRRHWLFDQADPDRMGASVLELRHVAAAYDHFEHFDIVHDHTLSGLFLSQLHPELPVVATNHGPFDNADLSDLFGRVASEIPLIAISANQAHRAPTGLLIAEVIHHGLDLDRYHFDPDGGDYLVSLGRMNADKGIHTAIDVALQAGIPLKIAAKMLEPGEFRYFRDQIEPRLGPGIEFVGEIGHADKVQLLRGARALLNPIQWPEPFGLVMPEALACGTPVIGTPCGAAPEIVRHGVTGYLGTTTADLVDAVGCIEQISRWECRADVEKRFSMLAMARNHERFYRRVIASHLSSAQVLDLRTSA